MIAIIDYGMGNLRSVQKAFQAVGHPATIIHSPEQLMAADRVVLPGVGAFEDAMVALREARLVEALCDWIHSGKPFLGICLGMQLLCDQSEEADGHRGLGIIAGDVVRFQLPEPYKVPHMGWNQVRWRRPHPLWAGIEPDAYFYFVHSYYVRCRATDDIGLTSDYGGEFCAAILRDNVLATQFHPEKSQAKGLTLIENFATWSP